MIPNKCSHKNAETKQKKRSMYLFPLRLWIPVFYTRTSKIHAKHYGRIVSLLVGCCICAHRPFRSISIKRFKFIECDWWHGPGRTTDARLCMTTATMTALAQYVSEIYPKNTILLPISIPFSAHKRHQIKCYDFIFYSSTSSPNTSASPRRPFWLWFIFMPRLHSSRTAPLFAACW